MMRFRIPFAFTVVLVLVASVFLIPRISHADVGVGIGTGKMVIQRPLNPGGIYELPALPVLNTGDEPGEYEVTIEHQLNQEERVPESDWFTFRPATFHLEPQQSQIVRVSLRLPIKTHPGNYFAYVEAHPVRPDAAGETRVGVAAAAKLYFSVAPANALQGLYYAAAAQFARLGSIPYIVLLVIAAAVVIYLFRRFFNISFSVK